MTSLIALTLPYTQRLALAGTCFILHRHVYTKSHKVHVCRRQSCPKNQDKPIIHFMYVQVPCTSVVYLRMTYSVTLFQVHEYSEKEKVYILQIPYLIELIKRETEYICELSFSCGSVVMEIFKGIGTSSSIST